MTIITIEVPDGYTAVKNGDHNSHPHDIIGWAPVEGDK